MSMHTEWAQATDVYVKAATADEHNAAGHLDQRVDRSHALVLSGDGSGALAIEGTADELRAVAARIVAAVDEL